MEDIFAQAASLPVHIRAAWLDSACSDAPELREKVEELLSSHEASDFMSIPAAPMDPEFEQQLASLKPEEPGDRIGNYKLVEQIGEGGFGVVWLAEQQKPVQRQVALKIIKLGMDTRDVIARFEQERQALAVMDHANIAKVYDAGATKFGRPYFVMELVRGSRITDYCDEKVLSMRERLELFMHVCQAVQHAHQKGIIHRDLKPSNILVSRQDGVAIPKVIDFGVAKAIHGRLTDATIATDIEQLIGTPLYMSPEQAELRGVDVDTRSDIYSLGVLLYELLTGRTPFTRNEITKAGHADIRRVICEVEPKKPSTAVQTMDPQAAVEAAARRQSEREKLIHLLRGDLDWITMRAMEKDRARRYATANGLSLDIQRYLTDEPVSATPPSRAYRFGKFAKRHRLGFSAAISAVAALVIGLIVALYLRERAVSAEEDSRKAQDLAEKSSMKAQAEAFKAELSEMRAKRITYASDMKLAHEAIKANNIGLARQILDRHRPQSGEHDLRDWEWRYLYQECRSGALAKLAHRPGIPVVSTSVSPNEKLALNGYSDGRVELWDLQSTEQPKVIQDKTDERSVCAFAPDGQMFVYVGKSGALKLVEVNTGIEKLLFTFKGYIRDLSYSRDGQFLVALTREPNQVVLLRPGDGTVVKTIPMPPGGNAFFNNARISPDNLHLYVSSGAFEEPKVRRIQLADDKVKWEMLMGLTNESDSESGSDTGFTAMALSPDGETLAVATGFRDPKIRLIHAESGKLIKNLEGHGRYVLQLAFSGDGQILASSSEDQSVRLWSTKTWSKLGAPLRGHNSEVNGVAVSWSGRFVVSGGKDGEVFVWDRQTKQPQRGPRSLPFYVNKVIPAPSGRLAFGRTGTGRWSLIDLFTLAAEPLPPSEISRDAYPRFAQTKFLRRPALPKDSEIDFKDKITSSAISPNGKLLVVASESGSIGFFDATTRKRIEILKSNIPSVFGVGFSPDGRRLAFTSGGNESVSLWDPSERHEVILLSSNASLLSEVTFSEDGNTLIAGNKKAGTSLIWNAPSWNEIEEAESIGGPWPQPESFPPPAQAFPLADLSQVVEQEYLNRIAGSLNDTSFESFRIDEARAELAEIWIRDKKNAEATAILRDLVDSMRPRYPRDDLTYIAVGAKLLSVILKRLQVEQHSSDPASLAKLSAEADELIQEWLAIYAQRSIASKDTHQELKLAVYQFCFRPASESAATCQRLMKLAESSKQPASKEHAAAGWALSRYPDPAFREKALVFARESAAAGGRPWDKAWRQKTLGMAAYRSGDYTTADQAFTQAELNAEGFDSREAPLRGHMQSSVHFWRALVAYKRGNISTANEQFAAGEAMMKPMPPDPRQLLESSTPFDDIILWLNYTEAKDLIGGKRAP